MTRNLTVESKLRRFALTPMVLKPIITWRRRPRWGSYMQFPFPEITTIMLLVHSALGCCWHHAHACESNRGESLATTSAIHPCDYHVHTDGCGGGKTDSDSSRDHGDGPQKHQCGGFHCKFVRSKTAFEHLNKLSFDFLTLDFVVTAEKLEVSHPCLEWDLLTHRSPPHPRKYILLQVLLI